MDGIRKCHPEQSNPITKEHKWYALTNKQMLAQKLKMNKLQFTQLRKLKKKDLSDGALVPLRKGTKAPYCNQDTAGKVQVHRLLLGLEQGDLLSSHSQAGPVVGA